MKRRQYSRPADLNPAFVRACRTAFEMAPEIDSRWKRGLLGNVLWEVWLSGAWLQSKLAEAGCPDALAVNIASKHGQLAIGRDPWVVAKTVLDLLQNQGFLRELTPEAIQEIMAERGGSTDEGGA